MNRFIEVLMIFVAALSMAACDGNDLEQPVEYLEVNAHNISGTWALSEWNGDALAEGTYVYLELVRNDRTYKLYQNVDSFQEVPHIVSGSYYIETDPELGAVIRGSYDHDSGEWAHRYIIRNLTEDEMTWVAKDDETFVQKFVRIDSIPL